MPRNTSARAKVGNGSPLIIGFVVAGRDQRVLVRGMGPSMRPYGVDDAPEGTWLSIYRRNTQLIHVTPHPVTPEERAAEIAAGAFPSSAAEARTVLQLPIGESTLVISTESFVGGTVLGEVYNLE